MKRSSIDSLIKFPLQIPFETSFHKEKEFDIKKPNNKTISKREVNENNDENLKTMNLDESKLSKGYIKYPTYDFF